MWRSIWSSSTFIFQNWRSQILVLRSADCPMVILFFLSPRGKCAIVTQSSLTPLPSILHKINCSLSPWHFPGRLNQLYHSGYSNTFLNSSRQHLTHHNAAIYILYGICKQTSVSIYVVRGDFVQMECVKFILSGKLNTEYKRLRATIWNGSLSHNLI
jgi:hypothetical protein